MVSPSPIYPPCFTTKTMPHGLYFQKSGGVTFYRSFTRVRLKISADIVMTMKPWDEVCAKCSDLQS